jgi:hypothetical protein
MFEDEEDDNINLDAYDDRLKERASDEDHDLEEEKLREEEYTEEMKD